MSPHARTLSIFALLVATIVSVAHFGTRDKIADNHEQQLIKQLSRVLPNNSFNNDLHRDSIQIKDSAANQVRTIYLAKRNNTTNAVVITALATDGYVGNIELLVGINKNGNIASVRVTKHGETPGLGDKIEHRRSSWITQFDDTSLSHPLNWAVKKDGGDFDQLTGATVTPRAVVRAIRETLTFFDSNQHRFFTR